MGAGCREALRDVVRAREAAKRDQLRARNRLTKFLLRHGKRPPEGVNLWTLNYMNWVRKEQQATLLDYLHEVQHMAARVTRLEQAIEEAVQLAPQQMREVIEALQALRGIAKVSAVTIVAELGELSRFGEARQLMAYSGTVAREHSSGESCKRGGITKTGNVHLRRIVVEAAWAYRHAPAVTACLRKRQERVSEEVKGNRLEGAASFTRPLSKAHRARQKHRKGDHGSRTRTLGVHLGRWGESGNRAKKSTASSGIG